ncbi:MAG: class I SAM-dependent methyltransferase [Bacteroidales bacterium]|nr:class I SAM-dependent methyltransferase [Bacteroidales bacterium]
MVHFPPWVFRALYWYLNKLDKHNHVIFMNYGYSEPGTVVPLDKKDEVNRYSVQLYHHVAGMADLKNKDIVEVGCGRGGGLEYISRTFSPFSAIGIDLEKSAIRFSNKHHNCNNLSYIPGNAMSLPLADNSCDVILNVESSHRYRSMKCFINEVNRVLRTRGFFLFADFRLDHEWPGLIELFRNSDLNVIFGRDITQNILHSLNLDSDRRVSLIKRYVPVILQKGFLNFSGSKGTETYNYFLTRTFTYKSFALQKQH